MRFDKDWFEKNQSNLLKLVNSRMGRWFFGMSYEEIPKGKKFMRVGPGHVEYDWKIVDLFGETKIEKTACFFSAYRFQKKFEAVYAKASVLFPWLAVGSLMEPHAALGWLPLFALTTTTFNPVAGANSPCDGTMRGTQTTNSFTNLRNLATAASASVTGISDYVTYISASNSTNQWLSLNRSVFNFDTSPLGATATISAGTFSIYGTTTVNSVTGQSCGLVSASPASTSTLATTDFPLASFGSTRFATDILLSSWSVSGYNDYSLNASGIAGIHLTGVTSFGCRMSCDIDNAAPTWVSVSGSYVTGWFADKGSNIPKLVVTYSTPVTTNLTPSETPSITETNLGRKLVSWKAPRTENESETVADSLVRGAWSTSRRPSDSPSVADSAKRGAWSTNRRPSDLPFIVDNASRGAWLTSRKSSDFPVASEGFSRTWTAPRTEKDAEAVVDSLGRAWVARRVPTENPTVSDAYSRVLSSRRTQSDGEPVADSFGRAWRTSRSSSDSASPSEILSRAWSLLRGIGESQLITEIITVGRQLLAVLTDLSSVTDAFSRAWSTSRKTSDSGTVFDSLARWLTIRPQGPLYPSVGADDPAVGDTAWTNPGNIVADDGAYATCALTLINTSDYLEGTGFGFAIPPNATVLGLKLEINRHFTTGTSGTIVDNAVRLMKAGTVQSTDRSSASLWPGSDARASYGGPSDLWGGSWLWTDVNDPGFGAALSVVPSGVSATAFVDSFRMTVYYVNPWSLSRSDNQSVIDSQTRTWNAPRTFAEAIRETDVASVFRAFGRKVTDAVGITDSLSRVWSTVRKVFDTEITADSFARTWSTMLGTADRVNISDAASYVFAIIIDLLDSAGITDLATRIHGYYRDALDAVPVADSLVRGAVLFVQMLNEPVYFSDIASETFTLLVLAAESVGITDLISRSAAYARRLAEPRSVIADSFSWLVIHIRSAADAVRIIENQVNSSRIVHFSNRAFQDKVNIIEFFAHPLDWVSRTIPTASWTDRVQPPVPPWNNRPHV